MTVIVARYKVAILASVLSLSSMSVAAQSERGKDVELGTPPFKPFYWLDVQTSIHTPRIAAINVDTGNRAAVVGLFDTVYTPVFSVPMSWTGSIAGCAAGTTKGLSAIAIRSV